MRNVLGALNLLVLLAAVLAVVAVTGHNPGTVKVTWLGWDADTTAASAAVGAIIALTVAFYLGQFVSWVMRLPRIIGNWFRPAPPKPELHNLVRALAHHAAGDGKTATRLIEKANPRTEEEALETYARLVAGLADPVEIDTALADSALGPLAALVAARQAAAQGNWTLVAALTGEALGRFGKLPALQALHLKALLNTGETSAAVAFLPQLRAHLPVAQWPLLETAVKGPSALNAPRLDNPWYKTFQAWLATDDAQIPPAKR
jgi:uncharacterized protein HemY